MDVKALDKAIQVIAIRRNDLQKIDYSKPKYDLLEEEVHDLEDSLHVNYGDFLEEILQNVHDKYCPDTDVLFPIAYLAKSYTVNDKNEYTVANNQGVFVEVDSIPGKDTRLVIVPNPVRVILNVGNDQQQVVWTAK